MMTNFDDTALLVDGRRLVNIELGCDLLHEPDQGASNDVVLRDVDQRIEKDIAVRYDRHNVSDRVKIAP